MQAALKAFETWKYAPVEERADLIFRVSRDSARTQVRVDAWLVLKSARTGPRPMPTSPNRSISATSMRWKRSVWRGRNTGAAAGRARLAALHCAGRGRGDSAVEFPAAIHGRHDARLDGLRQYSGTEALGRFADHCGKVLRGPGRSRPAPTAWSISAPARQQLRQRCRRTSQDALHRLHRIEGSRAATSISAPRRSSPARSGSSAPFSRWAARIPSLSMRTPISTPPSKASPAPPSDSGAEVFGLLAGDRGRAHLR